MVAPVTVSRLDAGGIDAVRGRLGELLIDSVANGASVGFLAPLSPEHAAAYWAKVAKAVAEGSRILLVATGPDGTVEGTVQLDCDTMPNQPHRATLMKLLVHSSARRRGIGEALMEAIEREALAAGRWLLTLDTATDAAERLYLRRGWTPAGAIPKYAMNPDASLTATVFYWKELPH